jgi:hypothetical protein
MRTRPPRCPPGWRRWAPPAGLDRAALHSQLAAALSGVPSNSPLRRSSHGH